MDDMICFYDEEEVLCGECGGETCGECYGCGYCDCGDPDY